MKIDVINMKGEKIEQIDLKEEVFGFEPNLSVLSQYIRVYRTNQRQGTSSTKNRSEVSGGGAKPWRQKGTGRARQGSSRSPIWVGGGVAHGPKPKNWGGLLSKSIKENALKSALSIKAKDKKIIVLEHSKIEKPKTKDFAKVLEKIMIGDKATIVWFGDCAGLIKSSRNLPEITLVNAESLGAYDVVKTSSLIFLKDAILNVQERLSK